MNNAIQTDLLSDDELAHAFEIHPEATLPDAIASLSKEKLLGPTISKLRRFPNVKAAEIGLLEKARDARNFIAHEGAAFGYLYSVKEQRIRDHLVKLRTNVADLARGDDVVSRWVYEIEEKEPAPITIMSDYLVMVDTWVFSRSIATNLPVVRYIQLYLRDTPHYRVSGNQLLSGTNRVYGTIQQLGGDIAHPGAICAIPPA